MSCSITIRLFTEAQEREMPSNFDDNDMGSQDKLLEYQTEMSKHKFSSNNHKFYSNAVVAEEEAEAQAQAEERAVRKTKYGT